MCEAIRELRSEKGLDWFLDSNVILGGKASSIFGSDTRFSLIPQVVSEIRKRPESRNANSYIDAIIKCRDIVDRSLFERSGVGEHFDFLNDCARTLSPIARLFLQRADGGDENRAIQLAANEGSFFEPSKFFVKMVSLDLLSKEDLEMNKTIQRSWYRYPAKRAAKLEIGEYLWTDETLVATAIGSSILLDHPTVIVSDDSDIAAIMKHVTDSILWTACVIDSIVSYGEPIQREIAKWYGIRCRKFDEYRHSACLARLQRIKKAPHSTDPNLPEAGEVIVCRPSSGEFGHFPFSPEVRNFICDISEIIEDLG